MLWLELKGRLGNLMFQYAAVKTLAGRKGLRMVFSGSQPQLDHCFDLGGDRSRNWLASRALRPVQRWLCPAEFTPNYGYYAPSNDMEMFDAKFFELRDGTRISGWFQSPDYFAENRAEVLEWFTPKERHRERLAVLDASLPVPPERRCCIHVRRTDYAVVDAGLAGNAEGWQMPLSYYHRALAELPADLFYVIISDDPDFAESAFAHLPRKYVSRGEDAVVDMFLMTRCRFNVIANSSFSWWGAWCNSRPDRVVFAPKYYLGWAIAKWCPDRIEVPEWRAIDVLPASILEPATSTFSAP